MKRLTLLTILLVVVGLTAGALEVKPAFTLSGSATAKWGVDLITGNHGFNNTASADLVVTLMAADGTDTHAAKDGWYGSITLSNVEASLDAPNGVVIPTPDVAAKIVGMGGNLAITVYGAPSLSYAYAGYVPLYSADAGYAVTGAVTPKVTIKGGLTAAYTMAGIGTLTAKVASIGDWGVTAAGAAAVTYTTVIGDGVTSAVATATVTYYEVATGVATLDPVLVLGKLYVKGTTAAATAGSGDTDYALGADFSLSAVKDLTFAAGIIYNLDGSNYLGFGAKAGYTVAGITAAVGFDGVYAASLFTYDLSASVSYAFMEAKDKVTFAVYNDNVGDLLNLGLTFSDAEGFVKGLAFSFGAYAYDLMAVVAHDPMWVSFGETASYKFMMGDVNYVKPYETVRYDLNDAQMYLNVGVEMKFIPNTTFTIDFAGGKKANDNNIALVSTDIAGYQVLTVSTTITY